jgi:putative endonuclease
MQNDTRYKHLYLSFQSILKRKRKLSIEYLLNTALYHNTGKSPYTSRHTPWEMVLFEEFNSRSEAMKREKWYKSGVGRDWINLQLENSAAG